MQDYLWRFLPEQQQILAKLISQFRFSFSNRNKFLIYVFEILKINELISFEKLIEQLNVVEILNNEQIQGKQKGDFLLARLFALRFPQTDQLIKEGKFNLKNHD